MLRPLDSGILTAVLEARPPLILFGYVRKEFAILGFVSSTLMNDVILMYIVISLIWLVILILSSLIFRTGFGSALISIIFIIIYIPIAWYYISLGEDYKLQESLFVAILMLIVYAIVQAVYAIGLLRRKVLI